ncbi:MAG: dTDP-4-dehydrorhamnose 3,5-epimerase [Bacteroidota bacterium]
MIFEPGPIEGIVVVKPRIFGDDRGFFYESYQEEKFKAGGIAAHFVQDNCAKSTFGVLRGLHYQAGEFAQAKLVRVPVGKVLDVAVDLRPNSPSYGEHFSIELSDENHWQLFVPRGFAHGYVVLSATAIFEYKCDNFYNKAAEGGLMYNDPHLNIDWKIDLSEAILSDKDQVHPAFGKHKAAL